MSKLASVEIITIGYELLIGQVVDTNSAWMAQQLSLSGARVQQIRTVADQRQAILQALESSVADFVLVTGGLGPTQDDITKAVLLEFFGGKMVVDQRVLEMVKRHFAGRCMPAVNFQQAEVPSSCRVLTNRLGTAPGMWFQRHQQHYIAMPGVPHEMQAIMQEYVLPVIQKEQKGAHLFIRHLLVVGLGESQLMEKIADWEKELAPFELAYLPALASVRLRLSKESDDYENSAQQAAEKVAQLHKILGEQLISEPEDNIEDIVFRMLNEHKKSLALAESCTGGYLAHLLSRYDGSSKIFFGSLVCYAATSKKELLGLTNEETQENDIVSESVCLRMAESAHRRFKSDFALATTGWLGQSPDKKQLAFIAVVSKELHIVEEIILASNDKERNIQRLAQKALFLLRKALLKTKKTALPDTESI